MKPHPQPQQKRPEPTPIPKGPEVIALALGETKDGLPCVALLAISDRKVLSATVLDAHRDAATMEEAWNERAYPVLYLGDRPTTKSQHIFSEGTALALERPPNGLPSRRVALRIEVEGDRVTERAQVFDGGKFEAWQELHDWASRHLLMESAATRRKRQGQ